VIYKNLATQMQRSLVSAVQVCGGAASHNFLLPLSQHATMAVKRGFDRSGMEQKMGREGLQMHDSMATIGAV